MDTYQSLDLKGEQIGISIAADMIISSKLIAKAHFTWQKTTVDNFLDKNRAEISTYQIEDYYSEMYTDLTNGSPNTSYSSDAQYDESYYEDNVDNEAIPSFWGSLSLTYKASNKLDITTQGYYFDDYFLYTHYEEYATGQMNSKFTVNTKVNYKLNDNIIFYLNGRNILNNESKEFIYMDNIGALYLAGLNINF